MMLKRWYMGLGWLACVVACAPTVKGDAGDSESTGASPSTTEGEDSSEASSVSPSAEDSSSDGAVEESETGEPSGPLRCLEHVGLPLAPGETIEGFADLDGDGMRELVTVDDAGAIAIFEADAAIGPWTLRQTITGAIRVDDIGDLDGDGRDDLVLGWAEDSTWWRAQPDGTLLPEFSIGAGWADDRRVLVADANGGPARSLEIVDGELSFALGKGDGTFGVERVVGTQDVAVEWVAPILRPRAGVAPSRWLVECIGFCTDGVDVLTLDDDGIATPHYAVRGTIVDIAHLDGDTTPEAIMLQEGALVVYVDGITLETIATEVVGAAVGDLDGDGSLDVAQLAADVGSVRWGDGTSWLESVDLPSAAPDGIVRPVLAVDIDDDGRDELVVEEAGRHALVWAVPCAE